MKAPVTGWSTAIGVIVIWQENVLPVVPIRPRAEQDIRVKKRVLAPTVVRGVAGIRVVVWRMWQSLRPGKRPLAVTVEQKPATVTGNGALVPGKVLVHRVRQKILLPAVVVPSTMYVLPVVLGVIAGPIAG